MQFVVPVLVAAGLLLHVFLNYSVILRLDYEFGFFSIFDFIAILIGIYITDFTTGFVHWLGDCNIPWKNRFLRKFHELSELHHKAPLEILKRNYFQIKGNIAFLYAPPLLLALFLAPVKALSPLVFALLTIGNLMLLAHTIHKWCHARPAPRFVFFLQSKGIIVSAQYHLQHHIPPYSKNFAAINGWASSLLAALLLKRPESLKIDREIV